MIMPTRAIASVLQHLRRAMLRQDSAGLTDGELLDCFITQRDEAAFEALLRRHGPMVLGVCRRILHNEADAEDAFQATFLVLVRKAASIRPRGMVGNWLYGVAHNTALKAKVMTSKRRAKEREAAARPKPDASAEVWQQLQAVLDQELQTLPDKYRAPIILCDLEGKSIKEAARQLDCPPGTIGTRLARGRSLLARRLAQHGLTLSGGVIATMFSQHGTSASVPLPLLTSTVKVASLFAVGQAASGVLSAKVIALTEGVLKAMLLTKLKIVTAVVLATGVLGAGAGILTQGVLAVEQPAPRSAAASQPVAVLVRGDEPPGRQPGGSLSRAEQFKAIQADFEAARAKVIAAIRAGKVLEREDGGYQELGDLAKRFAKRTREFINAEPRDEVALDAILFSIRQLWADENDRSL
ncbi:MAG: RNA polymerase sigma factor, partial [Gemmataceae bacterium]|nr:RNA polymerase sigma factor [Gemmataceae bacterium]